MRALLLLALIGAVGLYLLWRRSPATAKLIFKRAIVVTAILVFVALAARGQLHWLFALGAAILPFAKRLLPLLRYVPLLRNLMAQLQQARAARGPTPGQSSSVVTRFLRMTLDHNTGAMTGEILQGMFEGRQLSELTLDELRILYSEYCTQDEESAALLEAYLDRSHGNRWREQADHTNSTDQRTYASAQMTSEEAYEILGLKPGASKEEITAAHRRLMQKLHPDRGGSTYLATKINQAKDLLLS